MTETGLINDYDAGRKDIRSVGVEVVPVSATLVYENTELAQSIPFKREEPFLAISLRDYRLKPGEQDRSSKRFRQLSFAHGRSVFDQGISREIIFGSPKYPLLGSVDYKGNLVDRNIISIQKDNASYMGLRVKGLDIGTMIEGRRKSSDILWSLGLPTEVIISTHEIIELVEKGKKIGIDQWKHQVIEDIKNGSRFVTTDSSGIEKKVEVAPGEVEKFLKSVNFYVSERALQVPERIRDLVYSKQPDTELKALLRPVFQWINSAVKLKNSGIIRGTPAPETFDVNEPEDIKRYLEQWLPSQLAIFLARMHKNGVTHGYPHDQNASLAGTWYDLDSLKGLQINGEEPEEVDYLKDLRATGMIFGDFPGNSIVNAKRSFMEAYIKERFPEAFKMTFFPKKKIEKLTAIGKMYDGFWRDYGRGIFDPVKKGYVNLWKEFVTKATGIIQPEDQF